MKAPPEIQALFGIGLMAYALVTLGAAIWCPKLLDNPLLRPRWWGSGPRASRAAAGFGSGVWLTIGILLVGNALNVLPPAANNLVLPVLGFFFAAAVIAQLTSGGNDAA